MHRILLLPLSLGLLICLPACDTSLSQAPSRQSSGPKNGEWINRRPDGTIKTRVNYRNGLKHGVSYLYYSDGKTVQLEIPYEDGKKNGISKKYFEDGKVYNIVPYADNEIHGVKKTFYRSGQLQSEHLYAMGRPSLDLKEYYRSGNLIPSPVISYQRQGETVYLTVESEDCRKSAFYLGKLVDDNFLPDYAELQPLGGADGKFEIDLTIYTPSYLALQRVICECQTAIGNKRLVVKHLKM